MLLSYLLDILLNHQPVRQHHYTCSKGQQLPLLVHLEPFVFLVPLLSGTLSILAFAQSLVSLKSKLKSKSTLFLAAYGGDNQGPDFQKILGKILSLA